MGMLVIRHKVKNYSRWRPEFDRHASTQRSAGLTNPRVFHSSDDPNAVVICSPSVPNSFVDFRSVQPIAYALSVI
jgi:hypothetical protein